PDAGGEGLGASGAGGAEAARHVKSVRGVTGCAGDFMPPAGVFYAKKKPGIGAWRVRQGIETGWLFERYRRRRGGAEEAAGLQRSAMIEMAGDPGHALRLTPPTGGLG